MRILLFNILQLGIIALFSSVYAIEYTQTGGGGGSEKCLASVHTKIQNYNFGNTYTGGILESNVQVALHRYFLNLCGMYSVGANTNTLTGIIVPVYQPNRGVVSFYEIYTGSYIFGDNLFYLSTLMKADPIQGNKFIAGFYGGTIPFYKMPIRMNNEAYLISLNPPFSNAYIIQWYSYFGRPLLVARDHSGGVTDIFIQNPLSTKNQKELVKRYLQDKWYHP